MQNFNTVLFDLDGTLLPIDIEEFLEKYFRLLTGEFSDLASPDKLIKSLYRATDKMLNNDGLRTNKEVFIDHFFTMIDTANKKKVMNRFSEFYSNKYPKLQEDIEINDDAINLVSYFKELKFQLVIATNPLFPRQAIVERIKWAGLDPDFFSFISSYENMHYAKPDLNYYREILKNISRDPEECIMIGNDMQEDIISQKIGIKAFLVEEFLIDRDEGDITPYWRGTMGALLDYFKLT